MSAISTEADEPPRIKEALHDLARRVSQLTISRADPEKFFVDRSEIAHELNRLARKSEVDR